MGVNIVMQRPYILSLDIGTGSVGYACMDESFNILKYHHKDAIGVYLFDGADTAEERRLFRSSRRRNNRRIKRLGLLQEILAPLVQNPNFYQFERQHTWKNNNVDFKNKSLSEVLKFLGYNPKKYPTIYHLQEELLYKDQKAAPELIYIALYHLVKYRGHFLFNHLNVENLSNEESLDDLIQLIEQYEVINETTLSINYEDKKEILNILQDNSVTKNDRSKQVKKYDKGLDQIAKMVLGLKFNEGNLFYNAENKESLIEANQSYTFDDDYEEAMSSFLSQEQLDFIELANKIYLSILLKQVLKGKKSIAASKVQAYQKFGKELKQVKDLVYKADKSKQAYQSIFVSAKESLKAYQEKPDQNNFKQLCIFDQYLISPKNQYDKLLNELKPYILKEHPLYKEIENKTLLKVLNTTDNASIPMQMNLYEAQTILKNQQKYHPEITDEMIEKVSDLITFRVPYYVGPLVKGKNDHRFGWMIRNSSQSIKPWNFDEVVNRTDSATEFIRRMTNKCTYLLNEDVLPKHSLLYQEMEVLNELNGVQIRKKTDPKNRKYRLEPKVKQFAFNYIFKQTKSVSHEAFLDKMKNSNYRDDFIENGVSLEVFGTQDEKKFTSKLSSYIDMMKIFGSVEDRREQIEEIILWITLFEDKKILVQKLKEHYPELTETQMNQLKKLNYSGWGRMSEKLLTHRYHGNAVIELLKKSDENFMEIITNDAYDFQTFIQEENQIQSKQIRYQDVADLATSPALKKGIWSTIKVVRELTSIFGEPQKIIMEFATEDQDKGKRQKSRKQIWDDIVKKNKLKSMDEYKEIIKIAESYSQEAFQQEKLWLYLSQNGKCMYSGERIDLNELLQKGSQYYEVDHIIPRSFIKDDSIDNKVLVKQSMNQVKGNKVPLEFISYPEKRIYFWKSLNKAGLISDSKLAKLMKPQFTEMDKEGFIQRQLVETRQISTHVRDFLSEEYPNTRVIPMKAKMVSEFRRKFEIPKIRQLNDAHHAIDAYLNGVVYHGAQIAYPSVDLFDFNFRWEKVRAKWKALGEFNQRQRSQFIFFFKELEKLQVSEGELLISKVKMDIDHFNINFSKKRFNIAQHFYKQTAYSPKTHTAKYQSEKTNFAVYAEMNAYQTHVVAVKVLNKKGKPQVKYQMIDQYVIEHYKFGEGASKSLALYLARRDNKEDVIDAQIVYTLNKGDLLMLGEHPCYFISSGEVINAKQFDLNLNEQLMLSQTFNHKELSSHDLQQVYLELANKAIDQYAEYLNTNGNDQKAQKIRGLFENTDQTHQDFMNCIDELFKATKASSARSEKIGSRRSGMGHRSFLGPKANVKVAYTSITGLKSTRPKSLFKLAESRNEL